MLLYFFHLVHVYTLHTHPRALRLLYLYVITYEFCLLSVITYEFCLRILFDNGLLHQYR